MANIGLPLSDALICAVLALPISVFAAAAGGDGGQLIEAARSALERGNFVRADELYTAAIREQEAAGVHDLRLASSLIDLGRVRGVEGQCGEATDLISRGIRIQEAVPLADSFQRSEAWGALGKAYNCQRQYSKAESALRRALELEQSTPAPRPDHVVELLSGLGLIYQSERNFAEAETVFRRAQATVHQKPQVDAIAAALLLNNFGMLLRQMSRNAESEAAFRQGLALAEAAGSRDFGVEVALHYNLASLDVARKNFREAARRFGVAVALLDSGTSLPPRASGDLLRDYAACLRKLGDRKEAKTVEDRAAALLNSQADGNGRAIVDVTELRRSK